ncbi:hypothetical protein [Agrobacterium tumefaciens]|uniref:hypothetical protein n=1 Tax=Agrobacterium tumefaciens TaxID=358 RepID=UPI000977F7D1|nr:hypothetical protein [Agrobacterium tumefaciens]
MSGSLERFATLRLRVARPEYAASPPSALPGISPSRGEIARGKVPSISTFKDEMAGEHLADLPP